MKKYVVGFAFNDYALLLIKKKRPAWQKGLYNGLGGHIEGDETPVMAMVREFKEECGIDTMEADWEEFAIMKGDDWFCHCFKSRNVFDLANAKSTTSEKIEVVHAMNLEKFPTISNIPALVAIAMDNHAPKITTLDYTTR